MKARRDYEREGAAVTYRDVTLDPEAMEEMEAASKGRRTVPVIVEGGSVTIGYGGG